MVSHLFLRILTLLHPEPIIFSLKIADEITHLVFQHWIIEPLDQSVFKIETLDVMYSQEKLLKNLVAKTATKQKVYNIYNVNLL